ncbi:MAG TPA: antibiotic biosynthesis monooxygenase [Streptosporangiaceae bacterium]|nr:antibiotic biosynthesis monooxygenase [Streptosporangiaceae bacterium]
MLVKVFPIKLKDGTQDKVEDVVREFAPKGPGAEDGTLSFRVYRDLIAGQFASMITEFTEIDHELVVGL